MFALLRSHLVPAPVFDHVSAMAHLRSIRRVAPINLDVREMAAWAARPSVGEVTRLRALKMGDGSARSRHRHLLLHLRFVDRTRQIIREATGEPAA